MPRPYPATPRVAHHPRGMPRPYPATPRVAHHPRGMPRPHPATPRLAHNPEAMPRPKFLARIPPCRDQRTAGKRWLRIGRAGGVLPIRSSDNHPKARHPWRAVLAWQSSALPRASPDQFGPPPDLLSTAPVPSRGRLAQCARRRAAVGAPRTPDPARSSSR